MTRLRIVRPAPATAFVALVALLVAPAGATTFVPMSERDLAARSDVVVIGRVTAIESRIDAGNGGVLTYVTLLPEVVLRGAVEEGEIVLRERGGSVPGRAQWVFGSAEYAIGEHVLVFLTASADGALHTTAMALGKYDIGARGARRVARRRLGRGAAALDPSSGKLTPYLPARTRDLDKLTAIIRAAPDRRRTRRRTRRRPPEIDASAAPPPRAEFTFLGAPPARRFEPDAGELVGYLIDRNGDADLGFVGSRQSMLQAFTAWSDVASARLALFEAGLDDPQPFGGCPDESRLVFNDPFDEISDPLDCSGILAVGGFCTNDERRTVNGIAFRRIVTGKVTFNNGWGECSIWNVCNVAEVATHEIGHTLGFGHSADADSVMRDTAHFDGRCASLADDDVEAATFAYPLTLPPSPSATASPSPTRTATAQRSPTPSRSPTRTRSATRSPVPTRTRTPTRTRSATRTVTATRSATRTRTPSATVAPTLTATPSAVTWPSSGGWLRTLLDALRQPAGTP